MERGFNFFLRGLDSHLRGLNLVLRGLLSHLHGLTPDLRESDSRLPNTLKFHVNFIFPLYNNL
jgi:hypothetical protein